MSACQGCADLQAEVDRLLVQNDEQYERAQDSEAEADRLREDEHELRRTLRGLIGDAMDALNRMNREV